MAKVKREIEIKFRVTDEQELRRRLAESGARYEGKFHEENFFCDDAAGSLAASDRLLRLRRSTAATDSKEGKLDQRLTYKEPVADPQFKVRNEVEVEIGDVDSLRHVLERLGFRCHHGYDKEREIWRLDELMITLDTLSFGRFVELEGSPDAIGALAQRLGFSLAQGITKSYLRLAAEAAQNGGLTGF